jgi:hypothetical protein
MVSFLHEGLLELVRANPRFAADLLTRLLDVRLPAFAEARLTDATLSELVAAEYRADVVVLHVDDRPVFGIIVEAQLQVDERKRYAWPCYAINARARYECPFRVVVVTPDPGVAQWANRPIELGLDFAGGPGFRPYVIGPDVVPKVTDPEEAARDPQLAVLSAAAHGEGDVDTAVQIALAAGAATARLPSEDQRLLYWGLIEAALSETAREILQMNAQSRPYFGETQRRSFAEGKAQGVAEGKAQGIAEALLKILAKRGLVVTEDEQRRIEACGDPAVLDGWLDRALTATSVNELLG